MPLPPALLLGLCLLAPKADEPAAPPDLARLRELLHDRTNPRGQSQAALLLVQARDAEAEKIVHDGLRQGDDDVFMALASAVSARSSSNAARLASRSGSRRAS